MSFQIPDQRARHLEKIRESVRGGRPSEESRLVDPRTDGRREESQVVTPRVEGARMEGRREETFRDGERDMQEKVRDDRPMYATTGSQRSATSTSGVVSFREFLSKTMAKTLAKDFETQIIMDRIQKYEDVIKAHQANVEYLLGENKKLKEDLEITKNEYAQHKHAQERQMDRERHQFEMDMAKQKSWYEAQIADRDRQINSSVGVDVFNRQLKDCLVELGQRGVLPSNIDGFGASFLESMEAGAEEEGERLAEQFDKAIPSRASSRASSRPCFAEKAASVARSAAPAVGDVLVSFDDLEIPALLGAPAKAASVAGSRSFFSGPSHDPEAFGAASSRRSDSGA